MEGSSRGPPANSPGDPAAGEASSGDWRSRLPPGARERIINQIMYFFRRHLPIFVHEGLDELKKNAIQFEEKMYTDATDQSDYLRRISLKLNSMEAKTRGIVAVDLLNQAVGGQIPSGSVFMNYKTQTGHAGPDDWQEEIYQKVKSMKESYFAEIRELHQKITVKIEQIEACRLPAELFEQIDKLKHFKLMLERTMMFLHISKNSIQPTMKEKLPLYEKQIISFVTPNRNKKAALAQQQGEEQYRHPSGNAHFMPLQHPSEVSNSQHHDNHVHQFQHLNLQGVDVFPHTTKQKIRKETKEKVIRKIQKLKSRLPSTLHPNQKDGIQQSIPSLLQQLINAIDKQPQGPSSPQGPIPREPILQSQQLRDKIAELQSQLESSKNVVQDLHRCMLLLQKQMEIEESSQAKIKSAVEELEIQEASARDEQNVSTAILRRELMKLAKAASSLRR